MAGAEKLLAPLIGIAIEKGIDILPELIKRIKAGDAKAEGPVLDYLKQNEDTHEEAEKIVETAEAERYDVFSEAFRLLGEKYGFNKMMPLIDAWRHTGGKLTGFFGPDEEIVPWQNEFEFTTATMMLMPDFIKNRLPIVKELRTLADSPTFLMIVTYAPLLGKEFSEKIQQDRDIDDILKAFRIIHQEIITGTAAGKRIIDLID
ncbi:hypothetical protein KBB89_03955 [Candidatus Gracilibacteria bacterium]|nr:hypothetical protein [Candidatus Gracilibacteria bacterium]